MIWDRPRNLESGIRLERARDSIPLSKLSPFRGSIPSASTPHFPLRFPLHSERPSQLTHYGNECDVILQDGCACVPELTRPPSPAVRTVEPSEGNGGGPWVRVPFTQHPTKALTLGLLSKSASYPSILRAGGMSLLTSSIVGLCPPTKLLEASGPIPAA